MTPTTALLSSSAATAAAAAWRRISEQGSHVLQHVRLALHSRLLSNAQKEASNACASCLPPDSFLQLPDLWLPAPSLAILCQPVLGHQSCCPHSQSVHCSRQKQAAGHGVPSGYQVSQFQTLSRLQLACAPQILAPQRNRLSLNPYESQQQRGYAVVSKTETSDLPGLIEELQRQQVIQSREVAAVMLYVDRAMFLRVGFGEAIFKSAYKDSSVPIGHSQQLPAPSLHALCLELMRPHLLRGPGTRALDVGCGTGYMAGCMGVMLGNGTQLVALERHARLIEICAINLTFAQPHLLDREQVGNLELRQGNLFDDGVMPSLGVFDLIHVGAAVSEEMLPQLLQLLAPQGRMVAPVGPPLGLQWLTVFDKAADGSVTHRQEVEVKLLPLTRPAHQMLW